MLFHSGFETVISLKVHKSIYRRMFLRLEIDFTPVYCEGYYGTGIGGELWDITAIPLRICTPDILKILTE